MEGGLEDDCAAYARGHFAFLHDQWEFKLNRHQHEANRSGCLHVDAKGEQTCENCRSVRQMFGLHFKIVCVGNSFLESRREVIVGF